MAVLISYLRNILSVVSDNHFTYGMTASPLLTSVDLLFFFVSFVLFLF